MIEKKLQRKYLKNFVVIFLARVLSRSKKLLHIVTQNKKGIKTIG